MNDQSWQQILLLTDTLRRVGVCLRPYTCLHPFSIFDSEWIILRLSHPWYHEQMSFVCERYPQLKSYSPHQFSSVKSLSRVWLFATPWIAARQASLSITNSWSSLKLTSIESVMPSSHLILCHPLLLLPQSLPASGSFPMSQLVAWGGQSIGVSALASVLPVIGPTILSLQYNHFDPTSSQVIWCGNQFHLVSVFFLSPAMVFLGP